MLTSKICTYSDFQEPWFENTLKIMNETKRYHRKQWEIASIVHAIIERGAHILPNIGLGFACGEESIPSVLVSVGGKVLASDRDPQEDDVWAKSGQQSLGIKSLFKDRIISKPAFDNNVTFKFMDMNKIYPEEFGKYSYTWASCAMEHLGSLQHGIDFVINSMAYLKPGGVAIYTTEYNLSSNTHTFESTGNALYRMSDVLDLQSRLSDIKCNLLLDSNTFTRGEHEYDLYVDETYKYTEPTVHLNLRLYGYNATAIRFIIEKEY